MDNNIDTLIESFAKSLSYGDVVASQQLAKISAMIVKERIDRGMTQREFANLLGVTQSMVSKWESEDYNFSIESLAKICEKLGWSLNVDLVPKVHTPNRKIPFLKTHPWKTNSTVRVSNDNLEVAS